MLDDARHKNDMVTKMHDFANCLQTSNLSYENHGANKWHSQEKGGLIMSELSHLCEILLDNIVTSSHQARTVSLNFSLEA
jgi:hypothetical protein